jgi:hypothetical protein
MEEKEKMLDEAISPEMEERANRNKEEKPFSAIRCLPEMSSKDHIINSKIH